MNLHFCYFQILNTLNWKTGFTLAISLSWINFVGKVNIICNEQYTVVCFKFYLIVLKH